MKSVNILSLFDGMACGMLAMMKAGLQVNDYFAFEIDKYAIQTAKHNFPQIKECGDVFNADFKQYRNMDYLIGGSPCFTKGHYVLTDKGYKDVSDIQVGDMVLTHKGRYRKVVRTNKREADIVDVRIMGYPVFHTTAEHPFYTLERRKATWNEYKNRKSWRVFSNEPKWTKAIELKPKTHFCGQLIGKSAEINAADIDTELAYILGRYVADGHIRKSKRPGRPNSYQYQVILSIGASKIEQFKKHVMHRHYSCYEHTESVYRVCFSSMELLNFIEQQGFGKGANNKAIPEFIYNLSRDIQFAFLSGYMDGDGHMGEYQYCASTVSPMLAFGLQRLVTQLYGVNVGVTVCNNDNTHSIGNREIHSNYPLYTVVWKESIKKQSVAHIQDGIVWTQVKNVCKTSHTDTVYNIEVDEDNSYTVNNVIVHNCTYWSIAQSPDKRETTASGVGWELFSQYVKALHEAKPKYFIYENNKSMSRAIYESISETFGFEPVCINSALLSAQNRQRLYWVGKRSADGTYSKVDIQQPKDKGILLKDVLDGIALKDKQNCIDANYYKGGNYSNPNKQSGQRMCAAEPVRCFTLPREDGAQTQSKQYRVYDVDGMGAKTGLYAAPIEFQDLIIRSNAHIAINNNAIRGVQNKNNASCAENFYEFTDTKANTLTTAHRPKIIDELSNYKYYGEACEWNDNGEPTKAISFADGKKYTVYTVKDGQITIKEKQYPIKLQDGYYIIRKLTVSECKRLQTVPEWYEFPVSDTQAYKMLGNGWTVDVIAHLIEATMEEG